MRLRTVMPLLPVDDSIHSTESRSYLSINRSWRLRRKSCGEQSCRDQQASMTYIWMVAHHQEDYLLTWNCTHIANARILPKVFDVLDRAGLTRPIICTPEELLTDDTETV